MLKPNCGTILKLAKNYSVVPVYRELFADSTTPIAILRKLAGRSKRYYLLESVEGGEKWGRFSFLGCDPILRVSCRDFVVTIEKNGKKETREAKNPLDVLREILGKYKSPTLPELPRFTGGFVGYFAYAMIGSAEPVLRIKKGDFADYDVMLFDKVIAYDHLKQKIILIVNMKTDNVLENYGKAAEELEKMAALMKQEILELKTETEEISFTCSVSKEE